MIKILEEKKIKYEQSERCPRHTEIVNINFFNIMESLIRAILLFSKELIKKDKANFLDYLYLLPSIESILNKINKKLFLFSKGIYNIRLLIKIIEAFKSNSDKFENNFDKIIDNLLFL